MTQLQPLQGKSHWQAWVVGHTITKSSTSLVRNTGNENLLDLHSRIFGEVQEPPVTTS